jgi:hypothetical protein
MRVDNTYSYRNSIYKLPKNKKIKNKKNIQNDINEDYISVFTLVTANIDKYTQNIINQG